MKQVIAIDGIKNENVLGLYWYLTPTTGCLEALEKYLVIGLVTPYGVEIASYKKDAWRKTEPVFKSIYGLGVKDSDARAAWEILGSTVVKEAVEQLWKDLQGNLMKDPDYLFEKFKNKGIVLELPEEL